MSKIGQKNLHILSQDLSISVNNVLFSRLDIEARNMNIAHLKHLLFPLQQTSVSSQSSFFTVMVASSNRKLMVAQLRRYLKESVLSMGYYCSANVTYISSKAQHMQDKLLSSFAIVVREVFFCDLFVDSSLMMLLSQAQFC